MVLAMRRVGSARDELYAHFAAKLVVNTDLDRTLVSFQANRKTAFSSWFKYREGFSATLIDYLLDWLDQPAGMLLDPFVGAGAALFASAVRGWDTVGIEVLPIGVYAIKARVASENVDSKAFAEIARAILAEDFVSFADETHRFRHIPITVGAFSEQTEQEMAGYLARCDSITTDANSRELLRFACFCILEEIGFTRKDGQYLRWDHRSGRTRGTKPFDKGPILSFRDGITAKLNQMSRDLLGSPEMVQGRLIPLEDERPGEPVGERVRCIDGSCLEVLPTYPAQSIDLVITSPPYCNRYDYTRTYALELAFLGCDHEQVKALRQAMLSCTVENRDKIARLEDIYTAAGKRDAFDRVNRVFMHEAALQEVLAILAEHGEAGTINNTNIPKMVRNYFYEMCFVIYELSRILRPGGHVVMVNDNVRYVGEEVPVDLILSRFAESFGMHVKTIWVLPVGKGNSSQQMGKHGRAEIRKCVYVWEKPSCRPHKSPVGKPIA